MAQMMTTRDKMTSVRQLVERQIPEIQRAVPRGVDPRRFARVALTTFQTVPALLDCTPASLMGAMMQAAAWGLELDPVLGQAYLVPYRDKCQLIIGYQGLIELARRSGAIRNVMARAVHEKDRFRYHFGTNEILEHVPDASMDPGPLTYVYAVATWTDGTFSTFDVMSMSDVEKIRERSAAKNSGPWKTDYEAMAKKTVVRRLCKFLPKSVELAHALNLDEQADRAEQSLTIDVPTERAVTAGTSLDQLTETMSEPNPGEPPPAEPAPPAPTTGPRPVLHDHRPATQPAPSSRDEARAEQQSRHEPRRQREPGEEG